MNSTARLGRRTESGMLGRAEASAGAVLLGVLAWTLVGCGGGGGSSGMPTPPPAAFEVVASTPAASASDVSPFGLSAHVTFSHPVAAVTVVPSSVAVTVNGVVVPFVLELAPSGLELDVVIGGALPASAAIEVSLAPSILRMGDGIALASGPLNPLSFTLAPSETNFPPAGPGEPGRYLPAFATLADGRLFVAGGLGEDGVVRADGLIGSEGGAFWSPTAGALGAGRWGALAGRLPDGRVLVAGGFTDGAGTTKTATSEVFDPVTGSFTAGPSMAVARGGAALVETTDGLLVIVGGSDAHGGLPITAAIEAFDPALNAFSTLSIGLVVPTTDASVAALPDGAFLVAGGVNGSGGVLGTAAVFVPSDTTTRTVLATGLVVPRRGATAVLARTGDVFLFGGIDATGARLASIERYDPIAQTFTLLSAVLGEARSHVQVVTLSNGALAIVGGLRNASGAASPIVDAFDPSSATTLSTYVLTTSVAGAAVFARADGGLVIEGGAAIATLPPTNRLARTILSPSALGAVIPGPRVLSFDPAPGAANVDVDAAIRVKFTKKIDATTLATGIVVTDAEGKIVTGTATLLADRVTAVFTPDLPLPVYQRIGVEVLTTVLDVLGTPLIDDGTRKSSLTTGYDLLIGAADDGSQFGYATASGDVNGDGIDDIVVSAYVAEPVPGSGVKPGQAYVVFGRSSWGPTGPPVARDLAAGGMAADLTISFETAGDQPGIESALQVGDIDGDGYADVIVGVHSADGPTETNNNAGEVFVVFGQLTFPAKTLQLGKAAVAGFDVLRLYGAATSDRFGEGMALGDVDQDGYRDIVVGATGVSVSGATSIGGVYAIFGGSKASLGVVSGYGSDTVGIAAATITNILIQGTDASDRLGWSAACADLDGDGYAEIIGGSTGGKGPLNAASSTGEAIVVFGAPRTTLVPTGRFAAHRAGATIAIPGFVVYGDDASDFAGWAMGSGDLDGDGFADLAIGALLADGPGNVGNGRGEANVVFGGARTLFLPTGVNWAGYDLGNGVGGARLLRLHGEADGHSFGDCFAIADFDLDGFNDLAIGDYQARGPNDSIGANVGEVSVLRGSGIIPVSGTVEFGLSTAGTGHPPGVTLTRFYGKTKVVRFGTTLSVGDFNGDGRNDLLTGANQAKGLGRLFANGGEAYVFFGRPTWWR